MTATRWTQLYYSEWGNKNGRVRRFDEGFEFWVGGGDMLSWLLGARGRRRVLDRNLEAIYVADGWVRFVFDEGDEVLMRDAIVEDFPNDVLQHVPVNADGPGPIQQ